MTNDFLFTDDFISVANKNFDMILLESKFTDKNSDFLGAVAHHTRQEKKLLIVVSKTPVDVIFPLIQKGKATTTLINPSSGIAGFVNKGFWDMRDISKARDFGLHIIEPIYQEQIIDLLENPNSCYIRINEHTPYKEQLSDIKLDNNGFVSFQQLGYSGSHGTLLCFGTTLINSLYGAGYLQEDGHAFDVFASNNMFFIINEKLKESIKRTQKLILVIDQHLGSLYDIWVMSNLFELGLHDVSITFITPYYQHINSITNEYMYEQAKFDGIGIAQRIKG